MRGTVFVACALSVLLWSGVAVAGEGGSEQWRRGACDVYPIPDLLAEGRILVLRSAGRYRGYPPPHERPDARWNLEMVSLETGGELWRQYVRGRPYEVRFADESLYILTPCALTALSVTDGKAIWSEPIAGTVNPWLAGTVVGDTGGHPGQEPNERPRTAMHAHGEKIVVWVDDALWCVDRRTGHPVWNAPVGVEGCGQMAVSDGVAYVAPLFESDDGPGAVAVDLANGRVLWRSHLPAGEYAFHLSGDALYATGEERHVETRYEERVVGIRIGGSGLNVQGGSASIRSEEIEIPVRSEDMRWDPVVRIEGSNLRVSPVSGPGRVMVLGGGTTVRGGTATVSADLPGRTIGSQDLSWGGQIHITGGNLAVETETVTVPVRSVRRVPVVHRVSLQSGRSEWCSETAGAGGGERLVEAGGQVVLVGPSAAQPLDSATGEPGAPLRGWAGQVVCRDGERVYAGGSGKLKAYDLLNLSPVWSIQVAGDGPTDLVVVGDTLVAQASGWIGAYDAGTGGALWERSDPGGLWERAGTALVGLAGETVVAVDARTGQELTRVQAEPFSEGWLQVLARSAVTQDRRTGWLWAEERRDPGAAR